MNQVQQILLICGFLMAVVFDAVLIRKLSEVRIENATLRGKVTPSLDQQFALHEHDLETFDFAPILREFRHVEAHYSELDSEGSGLTLLFYFPNRTSCRRSLHREVGILREKRDFLDRSGISVSMVFGSSINETDFQTMVRQFDISDIAVLDRQGVFQRHLGPRVGGVVMLLDPRDRVLYAQFARTSSDEGTRPLYRKLNLVSVLWGE